MPLVLAGATSGSTTIQATDAVTQTITLPNATGTVVVTSGSQTIEFADGSASTPSITNSGDTNTGMFFPAADTIAFAEGGVEAMRLDASGNVGIGTTSPGAKLQVTGANVGTTAGNKSDLLSLVTSSGANSDLFIFEDRRVANGSSHTTTMNFIYRRIDATTMGYIGFGSTGSAYPPLSFGSDTTEYMRILSTGDMLLGQTAYTTPPTQTNDFFSGGLIINPTRRTTGSGANCFWNSADGVFSRSTSSLRYKTDVQDAIHGLSDVLKLRPITYKGKSETDEGKIFGGFLAEEVDEIGLKEFVEYDVDNKPDSLAYGNMVSLLTKAIQEQQAIIETLKADIAELKAKVK